MVKVHIHANEPEKIFTALLPFSKIPILKKEKVEDMFKERDETHGVDDNPMYQPLPAHAKFQIVSSGVCVVPREQVGLAAMYPIYVVPASTEEPIDCRYETDNDTIATLNSQRHWDTFERLMTAAPTPITIKLELVALLEAAPQKPILLSSFNKMASAIHRNCCDALEQLTPEQKEQVTVLDHGLVFGEGVVMREAIRAAREGNTIEQAIERCNNVTRRVFFCGMLSKMSFKLLALTGRAPNLKLPDGPTGKLIMIHPAAGEVEIADGTIFCVGAAPPVPEVEPNDGQVRIFLREPNSCS